MNFVPSYGLSTSRLACPSESVVAIVNVCALEGRREQATLVPSWLYSCPVPAPPPPAQPALIPKCFTPNPSRGSAALLTVRGTILHTRDWIPRMPMTAAFVSRKLGWRGGRPGIRPHTPVLNIITVEPIESIGITDSTHIRASKVKL